MNTDKSVNMEYFLGANTGKGFNSLFGQSYDPFDGWRIWIIKGGPGTGKSTAMSRVAARAGELGVSCELCRCSSDPDSLDAVIIPELKRAVYDGTAPHVMEPRLAGACENIVNFGEAWDKSKLYQNRAGIAEYSAKCSAFHSAAQRWLKAADAFRDNTCLIAKTCADGDKINRAAEHIAEKALSGRMYQEVSYAESEIRQFTAVTPKGVIMPCKSALGDIAARLVVEDRTGAASAMLLDRLVWLLSVSGVRTVKGVCSQSGRTEHIYAPDLSFLISVNNDFHSIEGNTRVIHSERFLSKETMKEHRARIRLNLAGVKEMTEKAAEEMARAKAVHDKLEQLYIGAMDYEKIAGITDKLVKEMFE